MDTIEKAVQLANEVFEDCPVWETMPDDSKLRFSVILWKCLREMPVDYDSFD